MADAELLRQFRKGVAASCRMANHPSIEQGQPIVTSVLIFSASRGATVRRGGALATTMYPGGRVRVRDRCQSTPPLQTRHWIMLGSIADWAPVDCRF
jgi:hypothetical protein